MKQTHFKKQTVMEPRELTVAEQVEKSLNGERMSCVLLVPDGDCGMKVYYRAHSGGAWWIANYGSVNDSTIHLASVLRDVESAVMITRPEVDGLISGDLWLSDGDE